MIASRGLGIGRHGALVAAGMCRRADLMYGGGGGLPATPGRKFEIAALAWRDERDLVEIMPALIGVLNAKRRH